MLHRVLVGSSGGNLDQTVGASHILAYILAASGPNLEGDPSNRIASLGIDDPQGQIGIRPHGRR